MILGQLSRRLPSSFYNDIEGHADETQITHEAIAEALRAGDAAEADRLMSAHIMGGVDELIDHLTGRGIFASTSTVCRETDGERPDET